MTTSDNYHYGNFGTTTTSELPVIWIKHFVEVPTANEEKKS